MSSVNEFNVGQRWITDAEPELGLGMVAEIEERAVSIFFPAADTTRQYSIDNSPLTRVRFAPGDAVNSREDTTLDIDEVREDGGLLFYIGRVEGHEDSEEWPETLLNDFTQLTDTRSRLFAGQFDSNAWYELRMQAAQLAINAVRSPIYGLAGARIMPVPHQLYIASEVANRFAPRALLADEVGLGKTIEACLVIHRQLLLGLASRVLVIVPDVLLHQWLVEWLRRFNLRFSLFDEDLMLAINAPDEDGQITEIVNPFESEQLVLCGMALFDNPEYAEQALATQWDIVVVDEAHHIPWAPDTLSDTYQFFEQLSRQTKGLLLLSATPEQSGREGHFARLHLLDPERFPSFEQFVDQHDSFQSLSDAVVQLLDGQPLTDPTRQWLSKSAVEIDVDQIVDGEERQRLAERLIDFHGTSRVFFRNTRNNIEGFPTRIVHSDELELVHGTQPGPPSMRLAPDPLTIAEDPRTKDLLELLEMLPDKLLVICAHSQTVIALEKYLRERWGLSVAMFHEEMSIMERDRAAAFFADRESKAQVLICSEIGSEGRNFQFLQHLYLFDLPQHPDLLEQRIGRLDRIGQQREIHLHIPWCAQSESEVLFRWYNDSMNAFVLTNNIGAQVLATVKEPLNAALDLQHPWSTDDQQQVDEFVASSTSIAKDIDAQMKLGRDRLVELSSGGRGRGDELQASILESDASTVLSDFLFSLYDTLGVNYEPKDNGSWILRSDSHNQIVDIPGITSDGATVSFNRHYVLANEDVEYISWEHPHTRYLLDLLQTGQSGRCTAVAVRFPLLPEGMVLLETRHQFGLNTSRYAALSAHFDANHSRLLLDEKGRDLTQLLDREELWRETEGIDRRLGGRIVNLKREFIEQALTRAATLAESRIMKKVEQQTTSLVAALDNELERLAQMRAQHHSVSEEEIDALSRHKDDCLRLISNSKVRLEAVRMIVVRG